MKPNSLFSGDALSRIRNNVEVVYVCQKICDGIDLLNNSS